MKKIIVLVYVLLGVALFGFSQNKKAKKPTIMVIPSDNWCISHGYFTESKNDDGTVYKLMDYKRAFQESPDLLPCISKINEMMIKNDFPLKNLESEMKSLEAKAAKATGKNKTTNPVKSAKCDIIMQLTWLLNERGPMTSVSFTLQGIDAYSNKQIATGQGTGKEMMDAPLPVMLETAVLSYIDQFNSQLMSHFEDLFANGREVALSLNLKPGIETDFETSFNGKQLMRHVKGWVQANTVEGSFSVKDASAEGMEFEQVRIPVFDKSGNALDTQTWAEGLQDFLASIGVTQTSINMDGLGSATITIKQ